MFLLCYTHWVFYVEELSNERVMFREKRGVWVIFKRYHDHYIHRFLRYSTSNKAVLLVLGRCSFANFLPVSIDFKSKAGTIVQLQLKLKL